jgi:diguanylate cyclase (GGDEF)-like protein
MKMIWNRQQQLPVWSVLPARCARLRMALYSLLALLCTAGTGFTGVSAGAEPEQASPNTSRVLTTARAAHSLTDEQALQAIPVHLRGVVTYFDPDFGTGQPAIFIHDASGGIFIKLLCKVTCKAADPLFVGALLDVRGVSAQGGFGPVVGNPQFQILGRAPLPPHPTRVGFADLKTGAYDAQWVEVEGSIHRVVEYARSVTLSLEMRDGHINVTIPKEQGATYSTLVDAQVRIHANAAPTTNADGRMIGVHLQAPNLAAVQVIEPAPSDPFALPSIPIDGLLRWGHFATPFHRIHLRGNVTLQWPGSSLCIRDATRSICAQTSQTNTINQGDLVDMAGFLETNNNAPVITDAVFRLVGKNDLVAPQPATAAEILRGGFDSKLVQIDGLLIGQDVASSDVTLMLSSGNAVIPAILPKVLAGTNPGVWKIGSRVRVTGICSVEVDTQSHVQEGVAVTRSFRVLLRSPADVSILQGPSWWTPSHAVLLLALALIMTLAVLGWVVVLRKRVEQQASQLRESEQLFRHMALHDALTGLATRLLLQDRLEIAMESAKRRGTGLAVLMVDLDKFKEVNDTYGHAAGDEVLRVTANRLLQAVRKADTVARLGGDEFVVLLQDLTELDAAERIAALIVESLAAPIAIEGLDLSVSVSVSVGVCAIAAEAIAAIDLLKNADAALYDAKTSGRNRFQVYRPEPAPVPETSIL